MSDNPRSAAKLIRNIIAALILVPLTILIVAFCVANRQMVTVSFDPFSTGQTAASLPLPLWMALFATLILGVVIGGLAGWLRHGGYRRMAKRLDQEVARLRAELDAHKRGAGSPPTAPSGPTEPPERLRLRAPVA